MTPFEATHFKEAAVSQPKDDLYLNETFPKEREKRLNRLNNWDDKTQILLDSPNARVILDHAFHILETLNDDKIGIFCWIVGEDLDIGILSLKMTLRHVDNLLDMVEALMGKTIT